MSKRRSTPIFRLLIIRALFAGIGSFSRARRILQLSNYQLITHYTSSDQLALGWLLAFCFLQSLLAQQDSVAVTSANSIVKTLGSVDYVEIKTPSASAQPKQLIIFLHGTPGFYTTFRGYLSDSIMQEKYHMIFVTRPGWRNDEAKAPTLDY